MEDLIKQAFLHVDVIGPHVADGHYDLVGPDGEIILPQVWKTVIEPDWTITMHLWPIPEPPPEPAPADPVVDVPVAAAPAPEVKHGKGIKKKKQAAAPPPAPPVPPPPPAAPAAPAPPKGTFTHLLTTVDSSASRVMTAREYCREKTQTENLVLALWYETKTKSLCKSGCTKKVNQNLWRLEWCSANRMSWVGTMKANLRLSLFYPTLLGSCISYFTHGQFRSHARIFT